MSRKSVLRITIIVLLVALIAAALIWRHDLEGAHLRAAEEWLKGLGWWGPVAFTLLYIVGTVAMLPGAILALVAGPLFGLWVGFVTIAVGSTTGAACSFLLARYAFRDRVGSMLHANPRFEAVDRAVAREGWKIVALLRLTPVVPFNLSNYLYGITAIDFRPYVLASGLAMLPGNFVFVYIGLAARRGLESAGSHTSTLILQIVGIAAAIAALALVTKVALKAIRNVAGGIA